MDPPSFTRKLLREEYDISETELNQYKRFLTEKAFKITQKMTTSKNGEEEAEEEIAAL